MEEIILDNQNLEKLPAIIRKNAGRQLKIHYPEYGDPVLNKKNDIPEYNQKTIQKISQALETAEKEQVEIISNHRYFDQVIPEKFNRLDYSNSYVEYQRRIKKEEPAASVIVATCNRKKFLEKTLTALFKQTFGNFEIIVADDNSEDGTAEMIEKLDPTVDLTHVLWPRKNAFEYGTPTNRVGPLRNLGAEHARGEILIFLDADIVANPRLVEEHVKSQETPRAVIGLSIREKEGVDKRENYFYLCKDDINQLPVKWTLLHSGNFSVWKKDFKEIGGFDPDFVYYGKEDEELGYRLYKKGLEFQLNRNAFGTHLYHEPEYINETLKKLMHLYHVRIFYKKHLDKNIFHRFHTTVSPHAIWLGTRCDNNCRVCEKLNRKGQKQKTTQEVEKEIRLAARQGWDLVFTGGEVMLREDIGKLLEQARREDAEIEILTNGKSLLEKEKIQSLKKNGIQQVMVYVFGASEKEHEGITQQDGSFKQTLRGIKKLQKENIRVIINYVVLKENYHNLYKGLYLLHRIGVKQMHITVLPEDLEVKELQEISSQIRAIRRKGVRISLRNRFMECVSGKRTRNQYIEEIEECVRCKLKEKCPFEIQKNKLFFRIDDVHEKTRNLEKIVYLLLKRRHFVSMQVIPEKLDAECRNWLVKLKKDYPEQLEIGQHGLSHEDHGKKERYEFGRERKIAKQKQDIGKGKQIMEKEFGTFFDYVFTPPYHGHEEKTLKALDENGLRKIYLGNSGLPREKYFQHEITPVYFRTDLLEYKREVEFKTFSRIKKEMQKEYIQEGGARIILHPQYFRGKDLELLKKVVAYGEKITENKDKKIRSIIVTPPGKINHDRNSLLFRNKSYLRQMQTSEIQMPPLEVEIELTFRCNVRCRMCDKWMIALLENGKKEKIIKKLFLHEEARRCDSLEKWKEYYVGRKEKMSLEKFKSLIDQLSEMGVASVVLTGGEPTFHPEFDQMIRYVNKKGMKGSLLTNGTLLDEKRARELMRGDWKVRVSFEGSTSEVNDRIMVGADFSDIDQGLDLLKKYQEIYQKGWVRAHAVIQRENIQDIDNMIQMMDQKEIPIDFALPDGPYKEIFTREEHQQLKKTLQKYKNTYRGKKLFPFINDFFEDEEKTKKNAIGLTPQKDLFKEKSVPCFYVSLSCLVNAFGDVYPCGSVINPSHCTGNVFERKFKEIWYGPGFNSFRRNTIPVDIEKTKSCRECDMYYDFKSIREAVFG